jgi:hypothetical protein
VVGTSTGSVSPQNKENLKPKIHSSSRSLSYRKKPSGERKSLFNLSTMLKMKDDKNNTIA